MIRHDLPGTVNGPAPTRHVDVHSGGYWLVRWTDHETGRQYEDRMTGYYAFPMRDNRRGCTIEPLDDKARKIAGTM